MKIVWNGIIQVINAFNRNAPLPSSSMIQKAINESDTELAKQLIEKYGVIVKEYEPSSTMDSKYKLEFDLEMI